METRIDEVYNRKSQRLVTYSYGSSNPKKTQAIQLFSSFALTYGDMFYADGELKSPLYVQAESNMQVVQLLGVITQNRITSSTFHVNRLEILHGATRDNMSGLTLSEDRPCNLYDTNSFDFDVVNAAKKVVAHKNALITPIDINAYGIQCTTLM